MIEVSDALKVKAQKYQQKQLENIQDALFNNPDFPILGNPNGTTVIAEFSDYQCVFCKRMYPILQDAIKNNPDLKVVLIDFPALGPVSDYAARAALATIEQGKYQAFHHAVTTSRGRLSTKKVDEIAKSVDVDVTAMKKAMNSTKINETMNSIMALVQALNITGTPTLIGKGVSDFTPGLLNKDQLDALIKSTRDANKKSK